MAGFAPMTSVASTWPWSASLGHVRQNMRVPWRLEVVVASVGLVAEGEMITVGYVVLSSSAMRSSASAEVSGPTIYGTPSVPAR
jgi:hypothetical protein